MKSIKQNFTKKNNNNGPRFKKNAVLSLKIESSFEKIRRTQIKSAVKRIGKIYIEKKKLVERKRKLISASTGCKRHLLIWHHRKWCVGYSRSDSKWRDGFQTLKSSSSLLEKVVYASSVAFV